MIPAASWLALSVRTVLAEFMVKLTSAVPPMTLTSMSPVADTSSRSGLYWVMTGQMIWSKALTNSVLMDPLVRHYGKQLEALMMDVGDESAALGVKETPAIAVLDKTGKLKKLLSGKIKARKLASALRSVAPNKRKPK